MLWMDLYLLFSCSMFILKIVSAENCCGKKSTKCCSRVSEARCHKVTLFEIARAACASVTCGFSSYSQSMIMRLDGELLNSHKNCYTFCCTGQFILRAQKDSRQPRQAEGLKAAGDSMFELDFKKQYASHCKLMFILHRTIRINNRVPECIFTNLSHNTEVQFSKTHIYISDNHFCPCYLIAN